MPNYPFTCRPIITCILSYHVWCRVVSLLGSLRSKRFRAVSEQITRNESQTAFFGPSFLRNHTESLATQVTCWGEASRASQKRLRGGGNLLSRSRLLGSLSNGDGDVNENGKKAKGVDWQNNNFARASRFSLPSLHDYDVKMRVIFTSSGGREHTWRRLSFSFPELRHSLLEFSSRKICQHLTNRTWWNKRDKVLRSTNSPFK